jgi:hypothetical protein
MRSAHAWFKYGMIRARSPLNRRVDFGGGMRRFVFVGISRSVRINPIREKYAPRGTPASHLLVVPSNCRHRIATLKLRSRCLGWTCRSPCQLAINGQFGSYERGEAHLTGPDFIAFEEITVLSWLINAKKHLAVATRTTVTSAV